MITFPNCKINLGLHVVRKRPDGYHDLETIFLPVDIHDQLEITPADKFSFVQDGIPIDGGAEQNIVTKAYRLMRHESGDRIGNVSIRLTKNIPYGAGLGGGSSDGAFTLKMLDSIFNLHLTGDHLRCLAANLGADCPFFIDNMPAYATGIGNDLTPLDFNPLQGHRMLLVKPDETVSTPEAYRGITPRDKREVTKSIILTEAVKRPVEEWRDLIVNDFEESVFISHPLLATIKAELYSAGAIYASMSGSGSTIYAIFPLTADHQRIAARMSDYGQLFFLK